MENQYYFVSFNLSLKDSDNYQAFNLLQSLIEPRNVFQDPDGGKGFEKNPHITIKYGVKEDPTEALKLLCSRLPGFKLELDKIGSFRREEAPHDVLFLHVNDIEKGLTLFHEFVKDYIPNDETYDEYNPHMTLAYIQKGTETELDNRPLLNPITLEVKSIFVTDLHDNITEIPFSGNINSSLDPIFSFTIDQIIFARDPKFLKHDDRVRQLLLPELQKCYGSTVEYRTPSSKFAQNKRYYIQRILFQDFALIAKDRDIPIMDAVDYAIENGDVHVRCNCPANKFWGYMYLQTQLGYLYGLPRENRPPVIRNPKYRGSQCKHLTKVLLKLKQDKKDVMKQFAVYFNRLPDLPESWMEDVNDYLGVPYEKREPERREEMLEDRELEVPELEERKLEDHPLEEIEPEDIELNDYDLEDYDLEEGERVS